MTAFRNNNVILLTAIVFVIAGQMIADWYRLIYGLPVIAVGLVLGILHTHAHNALLNASFVNTATPVPPAKSLNLQYIAFAILINGLGTLLLNFSTVSPLLGWSLHFLGLTIYCLTLLPRTLLNKIYQWPFKDNKEYAFLTALLLISAVIIRIYALTSLPRGIWFDEANYSLIGIDILASAQNMAIYQGHPANSSFYYNALVAIFISIFGNTILAIRLLSVALASLGIWVSLKLTNKLFGATVAVVFTGLLTASRWHLTLSRIGMHNIAVPLFVIAILGFAALAIKTKQRFYFVLLGLCMGGSIWFYMAIQPLLMAVVLLLLVWLFSNQIAFKLNVQLLSWSVLSALMVVFPLAVFAVTNTDVFFGRAQSQSVIDLENLVQTFRVITQSTITHLEMFTIQGDANGRHNIPFAPLLDPITGGLFLLGAMMLIKTIKKPVSFSLLLLTAFALLGGILSAPDEAPHALRTVGVLVIVYCIAALPLISLVALPTKSAWPQWMAVLCVLGATTVNTYQYFNSQRYDSQVWQAHSVYDTILAERVLDEAPTTQLYSLTDSNTPIARFLLGPRAQSITNIANIGAINPVEQSMLVIGNPDQTTLFDEIQQRFPDGTLEIIYTPDGSQAVQFQYSWQP